MFQKFNKILVLLLFLNLIVYFNLSLGEGQINKETEKLKRYQIYLNDIELRHKNLEEFKNLFIYFNFGTREMEGWRGPKKRINPLIEKNQLDLSSKPVGKLATIIDAELKEVNIPDQFNKDLKVISWQVNLDHDPFKEILIAIKLDKEMPPDGGAFPGDTCEVLHIAHIIFLIDPVKRSQNDQKVQTLSKQVYTKDRCECVSCQYAELVDVYDFDGDGLSEIITYYWGYEEAGYIVYGYHKEKGYTAISYHYYWGY